MLLRTTTSQLSVETGGDDRPHRPVQNVVLQQRFDDTESFHNRSHPFAVLPTDSAGHVHECLGREVVLECRGPEVIDVPSGRRKHTIEVVDGEALTGNTVEVVSTELEHVQPSPGIRHTMQRGRIGRLCRRVVSENVIHGAVDDRVESAVSSVELGDVADPEIDIHPRPSGIELGPVYRRR